MDIKVQQLNVLQRSAEWYSLRNRYIGASEVSALLGINEYFNVKDLLFSKLGFLKDIESNVMSIGTMFENDILSKFDYYEYNEIETMNNYLQNRKLRTSYRCNETYLLYINDVPFIVSPDGYFFDENNNKIPIETKFVDVFSIKVSDVELSVGKYAWQSIMQQLTFNSDYGYIFTLVSNKNLLLHKVLLKNYMQYIEDLVEKAREFYDILNTCVINNLNIKDVNESFYKDVNVSDISRIKEDQLFIINTEIDNSYRGNRTINGDEVDVEYANKYIIANEKEREMKILKDTIKKYFILKYGDLGIPVVADIYKIKIRPKFNVSITTPENNE